MLARIAWLQTLVCVFLSLVGAVPAPARAEEEEEERVPLLRDETQPMDLPATEQLEQAARALDQRSKEEGLRGADLAVTQLSTFGGAGLGLLDAKRLVAYGADEAAALRLARGVFLAVRRAWLVDPGTVRDLGEHFQVLAMLLERRAKVEGTVALAAAFARLVHAWTEGLTEGYVPDARRLAAAADVVRGAGEQDRVPPSDWLAFLRGLAYGAAAHPAVGAWLDAETRRAQEQQVGEAPLRLLGIARALGNAMRAADMEDKTAGPLLTAALTPLAAADALPDKDFHLIGLFNQSLTRARRLKLPLKLSYRTRRERTRSDLLAVEVPLGCGWRSYPGDGDQDDGSWVRDRGVRDHVKLQVWKYSTSTDYVDDDGKVIGGDNVGGRLKSFFESDKASLRKVKRATAAVGTLSRGVPRSRGYEVRGEDDVGVTHWFREWYYKSDVRRSVINVSLRRKGIVLDPDPEIEAMLESITELGEARK